MATTTTNFGWDIPQSTDLVKDGATAIATLGQDIDTALVDLKGGTTGQILAKNSNTDLDYTWINNDQGDITAVTAGTGLTGGGSSGAVTLTNDMATTITAAGDIVVGTGSGTYDNLPIGTTGQVLTADTSVSPYKVKWGTVSSGLIKQVVFGSTTTSVTVNNSTTYVDTNLTATITPTSASSTILVMVTQGIKVQRNAAIADAKIRLMRDSTEAIAWNGEFVGMEAAASGVTYNRLSSRGNFDYVDSPATTSAVVYKTQGAMPSATSGREVVFNDGMQSSIVLMEIGA